MYNLVYINTHDTGRCISPYGYNIPTENLSKFAKDATLFTHCYCCGPTCSPSRASMLTGLFPHQNGMLGLAQRGFSLNNPSQHLASYLRTKGYDTALSGIQHEVGWYLDIDESKLHELGYNHILTSDSKIYSKKEDLHLWDKQNCLNAIKWLQERDSSKPFMLSFGMHSTHRPYPIIEDDDIDENQVHPLFPMDSNSQTRHDQAQFIQSAKNADSNIGLLIDALKEIGLYENTVIIFTTDHGVANPFHKCNLKDDGVGVSLIIKAINEGRGKVCDSIISHIDIFPTLCDLIAVEKPDYLEGNSYKAAFSNPNVTIDEYVYGEVNFHTSYEPIRSIRDSRYKYIRYFDASWNKYNLSNIDESLSKSFLMECGLQDLTKPMEALYDTYYDAHENNNVIDDPTYQDVLIRLREKLIKHMKDTNDPLLNGELEFKSCYKVNKKECLTASSKNPNDYDERGRY